METREHLAQKFESLTGKISCLHRQAGDVSARPSQRSDQTSFNGVDRNREDNRDDRRRLLCGEDRASHRKDDIHLEADELGRDLRVAFRASLRPPILDRDRATFDPAEFTQPLHKSRRPTTPG